MLLGETEVMSIKDTATYLVRNFIETILTHGEKELKII